jgi:hypothetical protein
VTSGSRCDVARSCRGRFARGHRRVHRHKIIQGQQRGTLMRHVLLLGAIATRTHRMAQATAAARLIALAGGALAVVPGLLRAAAATVDLAAIAAAADEHLSLAADTEEQPAGRLVGLSLARAWTMSAMGGILAPHACSARCGARRRSQTCRFRSPPCLPCQSDRSSPPPLCASEPSPQATHRPPATACGYVDNARALPTSPQAQQAASINLIVQEEKVSDRPQHRAAPSLRGSGSPFTARAAEARFAPHEHGHMHAGAQMHVGPSATGEDLWYLTC